MGRRARRRCPTDESKHREDRKNACAGSICQRYGKFAPQTSAFTKLFSSALYLSAPPGPFTNMALFFRHRLTRRATEGLTYGN